MNFKKNLLFLLKLTRLAFFLFKTFNKTTNNITTEFLTRKTVYRQFLTLTLTVHRLRHLPFHILHRSTHKPSHHRTWHSGLQTTSKVHLNRHTTTIILIKFWIDCRMQVKFIKFKSIFITGTYLLYFNENIVSLLLNNLYSFHFFYIILIHNKKKIIIK